jgi:branched-chain amino acid aminotransferase
MSWQFWYDGKWMDEQPRLLGPADNAFWMSTIVFDGARAIAGLVPDLDLHCERVVHSARRMLLGPKLDAPEILRLCLEGVRRFGDDAVLYIRPMFYATGGFVVPDPDTTDFVLAIHDLPLPDPAGFSIGISPFSRPRPDMAPVDAKASCLYPNSQRALVWAARNGFDNAVVLDPDGNVAELATANLMLVKNGRVLTPKPNGTFLDGVTRRRVIQLLRADGVEVEETIIAAQDLADADEIFSTGNHGKIVPVNRIGRRHLRVGPLTAQARALYFDWAKSSAHCYS